MKSVERHKLKENELARSVARAQELVQGRQGELTTMVSAVVVLVLLVGGYTYWRQWRNDKANGMLAAAITIYQAPVVPAAAPAPGSPVPVPQAGTYQTERAKLDAALPKFIETADAYPGSDAGVAARYHAASIMAASGKYNEAEQGYRQVIDKAGRSVYGRTARLGLADTQVAQGKYDEAIKLYTELSTDSTSQLPVDGVLMQLGRAYQKAGRKDDAARTFNRVVEEFPLSVYASDARRELEEVRKG
jgi:TolA-binding protein